MFSFTVVFYSTSNMFLLNINEFLYSYPELLPSIVLISAALCAVVFACLALLPENKVLEVSIAVVLAMSTLFWAQGNMLVWDYGVLDGRDFDWDSKLLVGILELLIWSTVILLALLYAKRVSGRAKLISLTLIVLQSVFFFKLLITVPAVKHSRYIVDKETELNFSSAKNVILLVLDAFNTDAFYNLTREKEHVKDIFEGFIYFPNAVGGFPHTYPSIPLMLTGQYYDNLLPRDDFMRKVFIEGSLPITLKNAGYHVYLPPVTNIYLYDDIASNLKPKSFPLFLLVENPYLMKITLFRYLPHFVKKIIHKDLKHDIAKVHIDNDIEGYHDLTMIRRIANLSSVTFDIPAFKYFHMFGLHEPYMLNEKLELRELPENREGQQIQAAGIIRVVEIFLSTLKKLGIYDKTFIIIAADHGKGNPEMPHNVAGDNMGYLNPLILIKPFASAGKMRVSNSPVSHMDIPQTVLKSLDIASDLPGQSMLSVNSDNKRVRRYLSYNWVDNKGWNIKYYPEMKEYHIVGDSWLHSSWQLTGRGFSQGEISVLENDYSFGRKVTFGKAGDSSYFLKHGWAHASKNQYASFSVGTRASLFMKVDQGSSDIELKIKLTPYLAKGRIELQRVDVNSNNFRVGSWDVREPGEYSVVIPSHSIAKDGTLTLGFDFPDAISPYELGLGKEYQKFGVIAEWFVINRI